MALAGADAVQNVVGIGKEARRCLVWLIDH
jgi:hypothetical protein